MKFFTAISILAATATAAPTSTETTPLTLTKRAQLCGNFNGFTDNSTSASPLVSECRRILTRIPSQNGPSPWVWDVAADVRWTHLFFYRDCMFGVRAKTVNVQFNEDDRDHLARSVLDAKADTDRIEGSGIISCAGGDLGWGFYKTRNSDWA